MITFLLATVRNCNDYIADVIVAASSTVHKFPITKCMGKIAVQLKSHRESEIASLPVLDGMFFNRLGGAVVPAEANPDIRK